MEKRTYYWLTTNYQGHFDSLKINSQIPTNKKDLSSYLWFENKEQAEKFLNDIKKQFKDLYYNKYQLKDRALWMKDW